MEDNLFHGIFQGIWNNSNSINFFPSYLTCIWKMEGIQIKKYYEVVTNLINKKDTFV